MKVVKWLDKYFEEAILVVLLSVIVIVMTMQIGMRYVVGHALSFPEELCRYLFIWLSFIGISYSVKCRNSLKIDILQVAFPKITPFVEGFGNIVFLIFAIVMIWKGTGDITMMILRNQTSPALGIPMWWVYISLLAGMWLTALRLVQVIIEDFIAILKKRKQELKGEIQAEGGEI